ncbi:MAG TPA: rod shape-determining protein MreD [Sphingomicrobium sp.]|nr:rod shape-determining protein MreD [Sphingomicrobium sp.]
MARSALTSKQKIGQGPVAFAGHVPVASVIAAMLLSTLPFVVEVGWFPDFAFLMLIAWRLYRTDVWPSWWAAPLGLLNDLVTGYPLGLSVAVWTLSILVLDIIDRRTIWRDYWIEWAIASLLILMSEAAQWQVAAWMGARVPFTFMLPPIFISIAAFPVAAWLVVRLDVWRLGKK